MLFLDIIPGTFVFQTFLYHDAGDDELRSPGIVNTTDKDGYTTLHYAVVNNWLAGVCVCLEAGANIIQPVRDKVAESITKRLNYPSTM